jgi:hypothetical protein
VVGARVQQTLADLRLPAAPHGRIFSRNARYV